MEEKMFELRMNLRPRQSKRSSNLFWINVREGTWIKIKDILSPMATSHSIKEIKMNNIIITNRDDVANAFNMYFVNVGSTLAVNISQSEGSYRDYVCHEGGKKKITILCLLGQLIPWKFVVLYAI